MTDALGRYARQNRNNPTEPETRLWYRLNKSQLGGFKFRRQHQLGTHIVDFYCPSIMLIVEVDGHTHDQAVDFERDAHLEKQGYCTLRFTNTDVMRNLEGVCETILTTARALPPRWNAP
jgi:very-short-patch-repair endonuclease